MNLELRAYTMITINKIDTEESGGLLSAISMKSAQYIRGLIPRTNLAGIERLLGRHIVHTDPHLDEYFAELIFRSCLPSQSFNIEYIEESLFSVNNDFGAQQLWPQAVIFGIGSTVSYGVTPLLLFDEHVLGKGKTSASCSEVVIDYLENTAQSSFPASIRTVLNEVNIIDEFGNAHPQHLGNVIKTLHNVYFLFSKGPTPKDDVRDFLSFAWKRSLIDCCIASIIYCLENSIDLIGDPPSKKEALQKSLNEYITNSLHKSHPHFERARQTIASNYGNQKGVFDEALLRGAGKKVLTDNSGNNIPQLLILSRICFACYACWGEKITNMIMMHFWETEFQKQINFLTLTEELDRAFRGRKNVNKRTSLGVIRRDILKTLEIEKEIIDKYTHQKKFIKYQAHLWVLNICPRGDVFNAHQAALNYINKNNHGCGLILIEDSSLGTKTLFRTKAIPNEKWSHLINMIKSIEPNCWYDPSTDPNRPAPFVNNGNKAHQYVQRSGLDLTALCDLAKKAFK